MAKCAHCKKQGLFLNLNSMKLCDKCQKEYELVRKYKIKDYDLPVIPAKFYIELKEAGEAIREIIKELDKKPIVIKILNIRVDTARDLVFKIYNKTNDIVKSVILCEQLIVYGNRYRSTYPQIDETLTESTELFRKGKYKQSIDLSLKTIKEVDDTVYSRFGFEE